MSMCARLVFMSTATLRPDTSATGGTLAQVNLIEDTSGCCPPRTVPVLAVERAEELAGLLKAVADPTRLRLLSLVAGTDDGEACICDLTVPVGLSQPTVSHHMKILVEAGLLAREQRGKWAYYRTVPGAVQQLADALVQPLTSSR